MTLSLLKIFRPERHLKLQGHDNTFQSFPEQSDTENEQISI